MKNSDLELYEEKLAIDKFKLDDDIESQAIVFNKVASKATDALAEKDTAKTNLATLEASLYLEIKQECLENGIKTTEGSLHSMILESEIYQGASNDFLEAKALADKWNVLKEAFVQRGFMLREMAGLYVAGYFAEFSVKATPNTETIQTDSKRATLASRRKRITRKHGNA